MYGFPEIIWKLSVETSFFAIFFLLSNYVVFYFAFFLGIEMIRKIRLVIWINLMTMNIRELTPHGWGHEKEMI